MIPEADINLTTKKIKLISESFVDFYFTGLYLPPGKTIKLKIHEGHEWKVKLFEYYRNSYLDDAVMLVF